MKKQEMKDNQWQIEVRSESHWILKFWDKEIPKELFNKWGTNGWLVADDTKKEALMLKHKQIMEQIGGVATPAIPQKEEIKIADGEINNENPKELMATWFENILDEQDNSCDWLTNGIEFCKPKKMNIDNDKIVDDILAGDKPKNNWYIGKFKKVTFISK